MELQKIEKREPLEAGLTHPDDRIRLSEWLPPQWGEMPRIRFWKRWYNVLWIIPLGIAGLIIGVALAQDLRQNYPGVQQFIARYPGISAAPKYYKDFPAWLRWQHFFNLFLMFLIIRAGIQILADHPACTGIGTVRRVPNGFVFSTKFRWIGSGRQRMTR